MKKIILLVGILIQMVIVVYPQYGDDIIPKEEDLSLRIDRYVPYGGVFTPKGTMRALIIYAQFVDEQGRSWGGIDGWAAGNEVPDYVTSNGKAPDLIFSQLSDFTNYANKRSISNYYKQMSHGSFNFLGDILKKNNQPYSIKISPDDLALLLGPNSWSQINELVIHIMQQQVPNFNMSPYDLHRNYPSYLQDASLTGPDGIADYVIIIYQYNNKWENQPVRGMNNWVGSSGGVAVMLPGEYFSVRDGHTQCAMAGNVETVISCMIHEIGHELYDAPHYMGANNATGYYFNFPTAGWGMMENNINWSANAWERWILGWTELTTGNTQVNSDIQSKSSLQNNGIYTIRDLNTTGDIIRVKIPFLDNCYLWIENHQNISLFDYKSDAEKCMSIDGEVVADISPGLYMFIENDNGNREKVPSVTDAGTNRIYILNAQGNYDYWHPPIPPAPSWNYVYHNVLYPFKRLEENPICGVNSYYRVPDDYPDTLTNPTSTNDTISISSDYNGKGKKEAYDIWRETDGTNTKITYARWGGVNNEAKTYFNRRADAFLAGDEVGLSGIVPAIAPPTYNSASRKTGSYLLNGISVKVLSYNSAEKSFDIQIKMDDYTLRKEKRWCGYIDLGKSASGSSKANDPGGLGTAERIHLTLAEGARLTLDKTGTPNRHLKHPYFDDFFNPTVLAIHSGTSLNMDVNSTIVIKNNSTLVIEEGALLQMGEDAKILVKKGSNLVIRDGARVRLAERARIDIEEDAYICLENGVDLRIAENGSLNLVCNVHAGIHPGCDVTGNAVSLYNVLNYPYTGAGRITNCTTPVIFYVQNETFTGYHYLSKYKIIAGDHVTTAKPFGPVNITSGSKVIFKTIDEVEIRDCFDVELGAEFIIEPANEEN